MRAAHMNSVIKHQPMTPSRWRSANQKVKQSQNVIRLFEQIPIRFSEISLTKALQIAKDLNIYAYDAYMIECARNYNAPLLTLDRDLINKAKSKKVVIMEVK